MALLGASSLAGGFAQEPVLIVARVARGLATAMVAPAALSLLTTSFPEGSQREPALGLNGSLMAAGSPPRHPRRGPADLLSWRWAFCFLAIVFGMTTCRAAAPGAHRPGEVVQVCTFVVVEIQGAGDRVDHRPRRRWPTAVT
jgi:MFS family permease